MTAITLKQLPDDIHRTIKRIQLDLEDGGIKKTLEEIYVELLRLGLGVYKTEKPAK
jgi:hypothetical protein